MDIMDIMVITAQMAMAGAVSALVYVCFNDDYGNYVVMTMMMKKKAIKSPYDSQDRIWLIIAYLLHSEQVWLVARGNRKRKHKHKRKHNRKRTHKRKRKDK